MKITLERNLKEDRLVFTITCMNPHEANFFGGDEKAMMHILDDCQKSIDSLTTTENSLNRDIRNAMNEVKAKTFEKIKKSLTFSIENDLRWRFDHISQEIYNWIFEHQNDCLTLWFSQFNPQRTKYYFDNDTPGDLQYGSDKEDEEDDLIGDEE